MIEPERHPAEIGSLQLIVQRADLGTGLRAGQAAFGVERHHPVPVAAGAGPADLLGLEGGVADNDHGTVFRNRDAVQQLRCQVRLRAVPPADFEIGARLAARHDREGDYHSLIRVAAMTPDARAAKGAGVEKVGIVTAAMRRAGGAKTN